MWRCGWPGGVNRWHASGCPGTPPARAAAGGSTSTAATTRASSGWPTTTARSTSPPPLSPEAVEILRQQRERFVAKFGREPGPDEPIFFDAPPVEQIEFQMVQAMKLAGIDPAIIYAYEKTDGLLVTESNQHLISDKDLAAWQAAVDEYEAKHRGKPE